MAAIATGKLLKDRFRLERTLGRGGMAAVWLGHDEVLDRPVAVKVLADTIAGDPDFVARFRREAQTAASLSHPNLADIYDFSEEGERPYLVMQFVPGENLAERMQRGEGVDCDRLARELLEALAHIHRAGVLHRDVKPSNVILEPDGTAKLIDFGIAQPRDATALTRTGLVLGTERYAAPEVMEGRPATERSDLYSAGVVLRSCDGACSRTLGAVVEWMTSRDPTARPASARQALARLEREETTGESTQVLQPSPSPPPPKHTPPTSRGSRWGAVAAILGVVAAVVVVALVVLGGDGEKEVGRASSTRQTKAGSEQGSNPKPEEKAAAAAAPAVAPESSAPDPSAGAASGAALNEEGYALIQAGEYEAAIPVLEEAVGVFPEGSEELEYAYALFNLGNALRLSGHPDEAIPILEQRLLIPNQTATVEAELEAARAEAGE